MTKKTVSIVGGGISGISSGQILKDHFETQIFEKESTIGGLIRCKKSKGNLFHTVGGHVFNSKNKEVLTWFWSHFNKEAEFYSVKRNAKIFLNEMYLNYPIENFIFNLENKIVEKIVNELCDNIKKTTFSNDNFKDFLLSRFGQTLCDLYFFPYNEKIWKMDLSSMPLEWLDGKLPMPNYNQILLSNIKQIEESEMVHSTFFYPKHGGSQFVIDRLAEGLAVHHNCEIEKIYVKKNKGKNNKVILNSQFESDYLIYCGDVRRLPDILKDQIEIPSQLVSGIKELKSNGTSNVLCEVDSNDISWLYFPEHKFESHRIIYTGNFSPDNNSQNIKTCVVEFSGKYDLEFMKNEIKKLPGNLKYIDHNYQPNSYIIHDHNTKSMILNLKEILKLNGIYLLGRFAEWEYYNMDKCMESAMLLKNELLETSLS